jgi:hypothetical protein
MSEPPLKKVKLHNLECLSKRQDCFTCECITEEQLTSDLEVATNQVANYFLLLKSKLIGGFIGRADSASQGDSTFRWRDHRRKLEKNLTTEHRTYIESHAIHGVVFQRMPYKTTPSRFAHRLMILVFHTIIKDGKTPSWWNQHSSKRIIAALAPDDRVPQDCLRVAQVAHAVYYGKQNFQGPKHNSLADAIMQAVGTYEGICNSKDWYGLGKWHHEGSSYCVAIPRPETSWLRYQETTTKGDSIVPCEPTKKCRLPDQSLQIALTLNWDKVDDVQNQFDLDLTRWSTQLHLSSHAELQGCFDASPSLLLDECSQASSDYPSYAADSCDDNDHLKRTSVVSMEQALLGYNLLSYEGIDFRDEQSGFDQIHCLG